VYAPDVTELFQTIHKASGGCSRVPHALRDLSHRKIRLLCEKPQEAVLRKGDIPSSKLLRDRQNEAPLEPGQDVRQTLSVCAQRRVGEGGHGNVNGMNHKYGERTVNALLS
jgi:hypothetical protein